MTDLCLLVTDLDGTILDHHTYQPGPALEALSELRRAGIAVVPVTSKTAAELRPLVRHLGLTDGWVVENGACVRLSGNRGTYRLGVAYLQVRRVLATAAKTVGATVRGFGDMADAEVAELTGLTVAAARRARCREWTETFVIARGDPHALRAELVRRGLWVSQGGRFLTVGGQHDKGTAVRYLQTHLRLDGVTVTTWAIGDAPNDGPMLAAAEHALLVRGHDGRWANVDIPGLVRLDGIGPAGFVQGAATVLRSASATTGP